MRKPPQPGRRGQQADRPGTPPIRLVCENNRGLPPISPRPFDQGSDGHGAGALAKRVPLHGHLMSVMSWALALQPQPVTVICPACSVVNAHPHTNPALIVSATVADAGIGRE